MSNQQEAWVKTGSDTYEDCLVGNKDGLLQLKDAIDEAIREDSASPVFKSDFMSVVCTKEGWDSAEESKLPAWQELFFKVVCLGWLVVLPILGVVAIVKWLL